MKKQELSELRFKLLHIVSIIWKFKKGYNGKARSGLLRREQGLIILLSRPSGIEPLAAPLCGQLFRMHDQRGRMAFHSKSKGSVFPTVRC